MITQTFRFRHERALLASGGSIRARERPCSWNRIIRGRQSRLPLHEQRLVLALLLVDSLA